MLQKSSTLIGQLATVHNCDWLTKDKRIYKLSSISPWLREQVSEKLMHAGWKVVLTFDYVLRLDRAKDIIREMDFVYSLSCDCTLDVWLDLLLWKSKVTRSKTNFLSLHYTVWPIIYKLTAKYLLKIQCSLKHYTMKVRFLEILNIFLYFI